MGLDEVANLNEVQAGKSRKEPAIVLNGDGVLLNPFDGDTWISVDGLQGNVAMKIAHEVVRGHGYSVRASRGPDGYIPVGSLRVLELGANVVYERTALIRVVQREVTEKLTELRDESSRQLG